VLGRADPMGDGGEPGDAGPTMPAGEIEEELMVQAEKAGLDFEQILPLMRTESGGDPTVKNKMGSSASGLFQFTDKTAKAYGLKSAAEYAALPPAKQIELGIRRFALCAFLLAGTPESSHIPILCAAATAAAATSGL
jgi:hypothetical protein